MRMPQLITCLACLGVSISITSAQEESPRGPWSDIVKPKVSDASSLKIINLHLKARGGEAELRKVTALRIKGKIREGKQDYKVKLLHKAPNALIVKTTRTHMGDDYVSVTATDGKMAWRQDLLPKRDNPKSLSATDEQSLEIDAALPFLFLNAAESGHTFSYRGEEYYAGRKAYVVHVWLNGDTQLEALFDTQSFHVIAYRQVYQIGSQEVIVDRVPRGLIRIASIWWENGYAYKINGKSFREVLFDSIDPSQSPLMDTFKKPPVRERWLKSPS